MQQSVFDYFYNIGVIPVPEIDSVQRAVALAEALVEGGLPVAEITLCTDAALDTDRLIARETPGVIVAAGTVINREQAQAACEAGAQFLVSPGMVEESLSGHRIIKFRFWQAR